MYVSWVLKVHFVVFPINLQVGTSLILNTFLIAKSVLNVDISLFIYNGELKMVMVSKFDFVSVNPSMAMPKDRWDQFWRNFQCPPHRNRISNFQPKWSFFEV